MHRPGCQEGACSHGSSSFLARRHRSTCPYLLDKRFQSADWAHSLSNDRRLHRPLRKAVNTPPDQEEEVPASKTSQHSTKSRPEARLKASPRPVWKPQLGCQGLRMQVQMGPCCEAWLSPQARGSAW